MIKHIPFTQDEERLILEYAGEGLNASQIGRLLGRARQVVSRKMKGERLTVERPFHRVLHQPEFRVEIPDHVLAERDRRLALEPRDYTAAFCGDPLPGQSMLEQRNGR